MGIDMNVIGVTDSYQYPRDRFLFFLKKLLLCDVSYIELVTRKI